MLSQTVSMSRLESHMMSWFYTGPGFVGMLSACGPQLSNASI